MSRSRANLGHSVRARLLDRARTRGDDFQLVLIRYALERLLYRLGQSEYHDLFVLKGALVFALWDETPHRATRDLDLLSYGSPDLERLVDVARDLCETVVEPDGVVFHPDSVAATPIREDAPYDGVRLKLDADVGGARVRLQVDVGFGDPVVPDARLEDYPSLLDSPAPRIRAYQPPTLIAEKVHAMVLLGLANSRMKDYYDIQALSQRLAFDGSVLCRALTETFRVRQTELPTARPVGLSPRFAQEADKLLQWDSFVERMDGQRPEDGLSVVVASVADFILPPLEAAARSGSFSLRWPAGGPWGE